MALDKAKLYTHSPTEFIYGFLMFVLDWVIHYLNVSSNIVVLLFFFFSFFFLWKIHLLKLFLYIPCMIDHEIWFFNKHLFYAVFILLNVNSLSSFITIWSWFSLIMLPPSIWKAWAMIGGVLLHTLISWQRFSNSEIFLI